jgi:hypothetical protein
VKREERWWYSRSEPQPLWRKPREAAAGASRGGRALGRRKRLEALWKEKDRSEGR